MEISDAKRDDFFRLLSTSQTLPQIWLDSLQLDLSNLAKSFKARGISAKNIAGMANQLLHGFSIRSRQHADPLLSFFYFLIDLSDMRDAYVRYGDSAPSTLGAALQEPMRMIEFLSVFVQPSIKHLHRLVANQTLELAAFREACSKSAAKREAIITKLNLAFTEVRHALC